MHGPEQILYLIIFFPLFAISVTAHEFAHAWAALREGDPTAKYAGRLTLNPMNHIDPIGVLVFVVTFLAGTGFGWAKPVPINPVLFKDYRGGIIRVSLAGVTANFFLVFIGAILFKLILIIAQTTPMNNTNVAIFNYLLSISWLFVTLNMILFVFNLIPVPPLDGSKVLMMILPREQAIAYERIAPYGMFILLALIMFHITDLIFSPFFLFLGHFKIFLISL